VDLWLWVGSFLAAVGAALVGVASALDAASKVPYSLWTSIPVIVAYVMVGLALACLACAARGVRFPLAGAPGDRRVPIAEPDGPPAQEVPTSTSYPVDIRLMPERDVATNRFRLVALNRGERGKFSAEVTSILDHEERPLGRQSWHIPWAEDGAVEPEEIPAAGTRVLDFVVFNWTSLDEDIRTAKWGSTHHWLFSSLPESIKIRYSPVAQWGSLRGRYFLVTVRVVRADPPGHADTQFKIGTEGMEPFCRKNPA
jgi:hypothetical protein